MLKAQYAVRGELYLKGEELRKAGRDILYTNGERSGREGVLDSRGWFFQPAPFLPRSALTLLSSLSLS